MKMYVPVLIAAFALLAFLAPASSQDGGAPAEPDDEVIVTDCWKTGGWEIEELLRTVGEYTGTRFAWDPKNPRIAGRKIEFVGPMRVPRERLFEWFQSLLSFHGLVLVPMMGGEWMVLEMTAPQAGCRPIFVREEDLEKWKDRCGVYIVTTVTLSRMSAADAAMGALSSLLTPGVGRINRVRAEPTLVIGDFAPRVVTMVRAARAVDEAGRPVDLRRYEELLAASATDTAALYFVSRIEEIRVGDGR